MVTSVFSSEQHSPEDLEELKRMDFDVCCVDQNRRSLFLESEDKDMKVYSWPVLIDIDFEIRFP